MTTARWRIRLAVTLLGIALILYILRYALFFTPALHNEMWRFLLGDVAFLFVQVPLVTLVIDRLVQRRQRDEMLNKLNMVIGAFFSEGGTGLLAHIAKADAALGDVRGKLTPSAAWTSHDFIHAREAFQRHEPRIEATPGALEALCATLKAKRAFLIGLLGNQSLFEHETFTELLWALTHLGEELDARSDLTALPAGDAAHLATDVRRAYSLLGVEWLAHMEHLQQQYPYLYSLALRTNPLDPSASVTVGES